MLSEGLWEVSFKNAIFEALGISVWGSSGCEFLDLGAHMQHPALPTALTFRSTVKNTKGLKEKRLWFCYVRDTKLWSCKKMEKCQFLRVFWGWGGDTHFEFQMEPRRVFVIRQADQSLTFFWPPASVGVPKEALLKLKSSWSLSAKQLVTSSWLSCWKEKPLGQEKGQMTPSTESFGKAFPRYHQIRLKAEDSKGGKICLSVYSRACRSSPCYLYKCRDFLFFRSTSTSIPHRYEMLAAPFMICGRGRS